MQAPDPGSAPAAPLPPNRARRVLASLNSGSLGVSIGFAVTAAVLLNPIFAIPFVVLLGTLAVYLFTVRRRARDFVGSEPRLSGFFITASAALVLGLLITLTAQLREREARARSQALEFELERSRIKKQAVDARLALLQAQVEPHFLFNTLANVQAGVESNSPRAADVLQSLIAYLRAAMPRLHEREAKLGDELALVRA